MWLEDFIPSEWPSESWWNSAENAEKYREEAKKAASWIKRTQKDESKAKKYDDILAWFLVEIIRDKKYDSILDPLFKCLEKWYSSNFLLWILSLIYLPISDKIREITKKEKINFTFSNSEVVEFDDNNLDNEVRQRINDWVDDLSSIVQNEPSNLLLKRVLTIVHKNDETIIEFSKIVFMFFFKNINFDISDSKASSYSKFIIWEVVKVLEKIEIEEI